MTDALVLSILFVLAVSAIAIAAVMRAIASTVDWWNDRRRHHQTLVDEMRRDVVKSYDEINDKETGSPPPPVAEPVDQFSGEVIRLNAAEVQSNFDRVRWAEGLIMQLPANHDGRNSWLLNYGQSAAAHGFRDAHGVVFDETTKSARLC